MIRLALGLCALLMLAACGADNQWATDAEVAKAHFETGTPASITLFTVINNRTQAGAHTGLLINGADQVMFDPAGSWQHPSLPERNDVHFGVTPRMLSFYIDYHARETYRVIEQTIYVTPQTAALVRARAIGYGAAPQGHCAQSVSSILRGVPGFESLPATWFPNQLATAFGALPGATTRTITDVDADDNHGVLMVQANGQPAL